MGKTMRGGMLVVVVVVVALALGDVSAAQKRTRRSVPGQAPRKGAVVKAKPGKGILPVGALQYDNDVPASRLGMLAVPVGNNFNTGFQDPLNFSQVSFRLAGCYPTPYVGARAIIEDINPTAMTVMALASFSAGAGPGVTCDGGGVYTGMLPTPVVGHVGPFFGGIQNTPFGGCSGNTGVGGTCEGVALSAGTMDPGMGFHGVVVNGGMYTAIAPMKNAIFRIDILSTPVELMDLSVE